MNRRLEIAIAIIQTLARMEPDLLFHRPAAIAHRALMIADILILCESATRIDEQVRPAPVTTSTH
ncbi:MAG: hypothetical protein EOO38_14780 [Cytophagaceae bacterium]|nr:MAG: hypothetical protein EOO38_14780 [Cytophagaceae bacterium]